MILKLTVWEFILVSQFEDGYNHKDLVIIGEEDYCGALSHLFIISLRHAMHIWKVLNQVISLIKDGFQDVGEGVISFLNWPMNISYSDLWMSFFRSLEVFS